MTSKMLYAPLVMLLVTLLGCAEPEPPPTVNFLRGAVAINGVVTARAWAPGDTVEGIVAPLQPECLPQRVIPLEDRRADAEQGVPGAGAALAFSPDGKRLAIGSIGGRLVIVEPTGTAAPLTQQFAEATVKQVAWSPDGNTLYVGEQSPDAFLYALDARTLEPRWKLRLADEVESSVLPADDGIYGRYSLPGAYAVRVLADGRILVAASHGWVVDGLRRNRSRLLLLDVDGTQQAAYPPEGAADAVFLFPSVNESAGRVVLGISRSADGPAPDLPVGGVVDLQLADLTPVWTRRFEPLTPYFSAVFFWEAVLRGRDFAFAGMGDGRAFVLGDDGAERQAMTPGVPVLTGGVPIGVGVGFAALYDDVIWYMTTATNIPWGSADPATRPPSAHPAENTVHALHKDGTPLWSRALKHSVAGVVPSPDGKTLLIGAGPRDADTRTDLFGAVLLDATSGDVVTTCSTGAPVDFRPVWAPDGGLLAVAEAPYKTASGTVAGAYQVTVFR